MGGPLGPAAFGALLGAGWLAGVALQLRQADLWGDGPLAGLAAAAAASWLVGWRWRSRWPVA